MTSRNSSSVRLVASVSRGSTPRRRTTRVGHPVHDPDHRAQHRPVGEDQRRRAAARSAWARAIATALGISSPRTIWATVARTSATTIDTFRVADDDSPKSGSSSGLDDGADRRLGQEAQQQRDGGDAQLRARQVVGEPSTGPGGRRAAGRLPPSASRSTRAPSAATAANSHATSTPLTPISRSTADNRSDDADGAAGAYAPGPV